MIYVIDHKDSFTHNVVHQLSLFDKVKCTNYDQINNQYLKKHQQLFYLQDLAHLKIIQSQAKFIIIIKEEKEY